ncbi:MAG: DUF2785 domain-containing protein [Turicibacter sp.]|nr:DUF2785 domain-containing protein [Turicibacter sp.]
MKHKQDLKARLNEIEKQGWQFPEGVDADRFVDEVIDALASVDSDLRELALTASYYLIEEQGLVSDAKCRLLLPELISEKRLLKGLGKIDDDSVFARAFYVYAVGSLIDYNKQVTKRIFTKDEILAAFEAVLTCFNGEIDLRDYVSPQGWAHAVAHYGDNLGVFAEDGALEHTHLMAILTAIRDKIGISVHQYRAGEDRRLAGVVTKVLERGLISEDEFSHWLGGFLSAENELNTVHYNTANFLWSMRFMLKDDLKETYDQYVRDVVIKLLRSA